MKKTIVSLMILALGLTACNKRENTETVPSYHFNIPAAFGSADDSKAVTFEGESGITSSFLTTDKIYVYNVTKDAWATDADTFTYLQPDRDGASCILTGDLIFHRYHTNQTEWSDVVTVEDSDIYTLFYMSLPNLLGDNSMIDEYMLQNGSYDTTDYMMGYISSHGVSISDYARAGNVSFSMNGTTLSAISPISFANMASMFRQRLSFTDKDGDPVQPAIVSSLEIRTEHRIITGMNIIVEDGETDLERRTLDNTLILIGNPSVIDSNRDTYFAISFDNTTLESGDKFTFTAEDSQGNVYIGEKAIPAGGLQNGKYYYGTLDLAWDHQNQTYTVTDKNGDSISPMFFDEDTFYIVEDGATISGGGSGRRVYIQSTGAITLTGNGTAVYTSEYDTSSFIYAVNSETLTIILGSNYTISCPRSTRGVINVENGTAPAELKFATTGGSYTLTCTSKMASKGFTCDNTDLAAAGFEVTLQGGAPTDNGDGTYTFVYTVAPATI